MADASQTLLCSYAGTHTPFTKSSQQAVSYKIAFAFCSSVLPRKKKLTTKGSPFFEFRRRSKISLELLASHKPSIFKHRLSLLGKRVHSSSLPQSGQLSDFLRALLEVYKSIFGDDGSDIKQEWLLKIGDVTMACKPHDSTAHAFNLCRKLGTLTSPSRDTMLELRRS